jgi:hypothetical protein
MWDNILSVRSVVENRANACHRVAEWFFERAREAIAMN